MSQKLLQYLQDLNKEFKNFGNNLSTTLEADTPSQENLSTKINEIKEIIKTIKKNIEKINLDVQSDETRQIKEARQTLYATLDDTDKKLRNMKSGKKDDEITQILDLIVLAKTSILTAPQIDNPIRHGFVTAFSYEYLLVNYQDIGYNPTLPNKRITIGKSPSYVHSIFSEEIIKETGKEYQIRDNIVELTTDLSYNLYDKRPFISIRMLHYLGDVTTIPSDLENMFKYVFWFQQKFRTCDLPFFPSVLTLMKMNGIDIKPIIDYLNTEVAAAEAEAAATAATAPTMDQLIKWLKYLEYYSDDCTKKLETLPSVPVVDKELNNFKQKMTEIYGLIVEWATKTYKQLYVTQSAVAAVAAPAPAAEPVAAQAPEKEATQNFLQIIYFYQHIVQEQSKELFNIILDEKDRAVPLSDIEIIQSNLKKITDNLAKYTAIEKIFEFPTQK
jgi:hypothetical protein